MLKEYIRIVEFHAKRRDFTFTLEYDENGKRTMSVIITAHGPDAPPALIKVSVPILDSWGMDLTDWADNLEDLSEHAMSAVDGVSEK